MTFIFIGCGSASEPQFKTISGNVFLGPESAVFLSCGSKDDLWIKEPTYSANGWESAKTILDAQPLCSLINIPCTHQTVWISGLAKIEYPEGGTGHLRGYKGEIEFSEVIRTEIMTSALK